MGPSWLSGASIEGVDDRLERSADARDASTRHRALQQLHPVLAAGDPACLDDGHGQSLTRPDVVAGGRLVALPGSSQDGRHRPGRDPIARDDLRRRHDPGARPVRAVAADDARRL
jgi:hypothetical protein